MPWRPISHLLASACVVVATEGSAQQANQLDGAGCLPHAALRSTDVRSDRRIDFKLRTGDRLRNDLPASCRSLNFERKFDFTEAGERICPGHEIFVANSAWGPGEFHGSTCALGGFSPVVGDEW